MCQFCHKSIEQVKRQKSDTACVAFFILVKHRKKHVTQVKFNQETDFNLHTHVTYPAYVCVRFNLFFSRFRPNCDLLLLLFPFRIREVLEYILSSFFFLSNARFRRKRFQEEIDLFEFIFGIYWRSIKYNDTFWRHTEKFLFSHIRFPLHNLKKNRIYVRR